MHTDQRELNAPSPSPELVFETLTAYQRWAALRAAIELEVFKFVAQGPGDVASLARQCNASERGIRILCDYLTVLGFLTKQDFHYKNSATSSLFLDPASPACIASISRFIAQPAVVEPFIHLAEIVRTGRTVLRGEGSVEPDNPIWVDFAHAMAPMMGPMAAPLGALALDGLTGPQKVLDVAAGHGLFGIELAKLSPGTNVTAVDWAAVLEVARANAVKAGVESRYHLLPGSAFDMEYGGPYDIVLLTNFLHHFDSSTCIGLLKKVRSSLRPGGRAAALEFVPNDDRISPPMPASFSMTMLGTTASGDAYTFRELKEMYEAADFQNITAHAIPRSPHTVVIGAA